MLNQFKLTVKDASPLDEVVIPNEQQTFSPEVIQNGQFQSFKEDPDDVIIDKREYPRSGTDPGLVVIFNQKTFIDNKNYPKRLGSNQDINALIVTFGRLGFNINQHNIHIDLTRGEIMETLEKISKQDHSHRNCLIVIILTHGGKDNSLQARDAPVFANEIWEWFKIENCPSLKNKPRFFIFQACKGNNVSIPSMLTTATSTTEMVSSEFFTTPLERDMLVAFASVEGNVSYRHIFNGAWYIQELCRNFSAYGRRDDVVSLLVRTTKCVANSYYDIQITNSNEHSLPPGLNSITITKQMPIFLSTLTRKFYLNKSKDRRQQLRLKLQQRKIEAHVSALMQDIIKR